MEYETGSQYWYNVVLKAPIPSGAEDITGIVWDLTNLRLKRKVVAALQIFWTQQFLLMFLMLILSLMNNMISILAMSMNWKFLMSVKLFSLDIDHISWIGEKSYVPMVKSMYQIQKAIGLLNLVYCMIDPDLIVMVYWSMLIFKRFNIDCTLYI